MHTVSMSDKVVDIRRKMPADQRRQIAPNGVIGMTLFVFAEMMLFAGLISAHTIGRAAVIGGWPPPDQPRLPAEETAINTVALLLSGALLMLAQRAFGRHPKRVGQLLLGALLLGAFFVGFQGLEWAALIGQGLTMTSSTHGAFFYLIVGTHALHALAALGALAWVYLRARAGTLLQAQLATVQVFWYFVVGLWPFLYWKVYW